MSLNDVSSGERVHIGFFGMRNAGKSSLVNAVTDQSLSVVSDYKGTTTDPVKKAMELLPIGPVVVVDTPGFDDEGPLGEKRVKKTLEILSKVHIAILVVDVSVGISSQDDELISLFKKKNIPYIIAFNKSDLLKQTPASNEKAIYVSSKNNFNINELKNKIGTLADNVKKEKFILKDLVKTGSVVVLCIPIDESAPKGRLILPQQLTLREILDCNATAICCQPEELSDIIKNLSVKPDLVITDSQVFGMVSKTVSEDIPLTSFSILMARYKGEINSLIGGVQALKRLRTGDKVLISEGCTHHRQCNDIGTVKMPEWIKKYTKCEPEFLFTSGGEFPVDLSGISLVVHCGGCMLNEREMKNRQNLCLQQNVPMVNYGMAIAEINGILERSLDVFSNH